MPARARPMPATDERLPGWQSALVLAALSVLSWAALIGVAMLMWWAVG